MEGKWKVVFSNLTRKFQGGRLKMQHRCKRQKVLLIKILREVIKGERVIKQDSFLSLHLKQ